MKDWGVVDQFDLLRICIEAGMVEWDQWSQPQCHNSNLRYYCYKFDDIGTEEDNDEVKSKNLKNLISILQKHEIKFNIMDKTLFIDRKLK